MDNNKLPTNAESKQLSLLNDLISAMQLEIQSSIESNLQLQDELHMESLESNNILDRIYSSSLSRNNSTKKNTIDTSSSVGDTNYDVYSESNDASPNDYNNSNSLYRSQRGPPLPPRNKSISTQKVESYKTTTDDPALLSMLTLKKDIRGADNNQESPRNNKADDYIVNINTYDKKSELWDFTVYIITRGAVLLLLAALITMVMASIVIFAGGYFGVNDSIYNFFNEISTKIKNFLYSIKWRIKFSLGNNSKQVVNSVNNSTYTPPANYTN
ncbi:hypothetical protein NEIG_02040 [Nematocida sp. ERTm5]|nr:hypothetical protein NEIG_02040 [Nematocida sp. ERTm5]